MIAIVYADGNNAPVRFREKPNGYVLCEIPQGKKVEVIEKNGEWSKIIYGGNTGYMMSKFLISENSKLASLKTKLKEVLQILDTLED